VSTNRDGNGSRASVYSRWLWQCGLHVDAEQQKQCWKWISRSPPIWDSLGFMLLFTVVLVIFLVFVVALLLPLWSWTLPQLDHGQSLREYGASNL
jgi:hypothetical protein